MVIVAMSEMSCGICLQVLRPANHDPDTMIQSETAIGELY